MTDANLVRVLHNAVARSDPAAASTRPVGTTDRALRRLIRDVLRKLDPPADGSVLEVGCGTGILSVPIARRVRRFVGIDFAEEAIAVLGERLHREGLSHRCELQVLDMLAAPERERLATFDRVLMYAVLHYSRSEEEGIGFLRAALGRLRPGGVALIGNLPLEELERDVRDSWLRPGVSRGMRLWLALRWILRRTDPIRRRAPWKLAAVVDYVVRRAVAPMRRGGSAPASLPPGYVIGLSRRRIEEWIAALPYRVTYDWSAPAVGVPLHLMRADLRITRER
jgi:SAM-dependent methyltransferase